MRGPDARTRPLGAILAGGRSRRYGSPKALAEVGGRTLLARAWEALAPHADVVLISDDAALGARIPVPRRPDAMPGAGPLGGVYTALAWAREEGRPGAFVLACDMPFVTPALVALVLARAGRAGRRGADAVVPESPGPRGFEPLCAYYRVTALERVRERIAAGELGMAALVAALDVAFVPMEDIRGVDDPEMLFLNVNEPADRERAERIVQGAPAGNGSGAARRGSGP